MSKYNIAMGSRPIAARARSVRKSASALVVLPVGFINVAISLYLQFSGLSAFLVVSTLAVGLGIVFARTVCWLGIFAAQDRAADGWFMSDDASVRTDKLTELRARVIMSDTYVSLRDVDGRYVDVPLSKLTVEREVWGIVCAAVRKSVASGLVVEDDLTARIFGLENGRGHGLRCVPRRGSFHRVTTPYHEVDAVPAP